MTSPPEMPSGGRPPLTLDVPRSRTRAWAFPISLALHAVAIALLASSVRRDWTRTATAGPIAIVLPAVGGGGGGGTRHEPYISPPAAPASPRVRDRPPVTPPRPPVEEP